VKHQKANHKKLMKSTALLLTLAARPLSAMSMSNTFPSVTGLGSLTLVDTSWFLKDKEKGPRDFVDRRVTGGERRE
jgi:hypothetical protein